MDNMTTEQLLERLRALAEARGKATGSQWEYSAPGAQVFANGGETHVADIRGWGALQYQGEEEAVAQMDADGRFIALAANTISPALLEAVEGLVRENRKLREQLIGPQKQPASVRQIEAQAKSVANQLADAVQAQSRDLTSKPHGDKSQ